MDKSLKQIKPMICPICGKFYFSELTDDDIEQVGLPMGRNRYPYACPEATG